MELLHDRMPCKNENCKGTILPSTADRTGGLCMPCFQAIKRREKDEYIRKNRKDVNLYEGIDDTVEILKIMHSPKEHNQLINYIDYSKTAEEVYCSLTRHEITRIKDYVIQLINNYDIDTAEEILLRLVCQTNSRIDECLEALVKKDHYYPGIIFKDASGDIRDYLIREIETTTDNRNHILCALSWIGDQKVVELFSRWRVYPPKWSNELYIPPENYSFEAGWKLTNDGRRENLFFYECYSFRHKEASQIEPVHIIEKHSEKCPWCHTQLTTLFDFDLTSPLLGFLHIRGQKLRISTCHLCTCYGTIFSRFDLNGASRWYELNEKPSYLPSISNPQDESIMINKPLRRTKSLLLFGKLVIRAIGITNRWSSYLDSGCRIP